MADTLGTQAIFNALLTEKKNSKGYKTGKKLVETRTTPRRKIETEEEDIEIMDDVLDNISVVTDPEKDVDDLEVRADNIQDAIEGTAEGEAAFSDEYIGDKVYACPVCGESFFADEEYGDGDACPICRAEPTDGFLLQGIIQAPEVEMEEEPMETDEFIDEEPISDEEIETEPTEDEGFEEEPEEEFAEESKKPQNIRKEAHKPVNKPIRKSVQRAKKESDQATGEVGGPGAATVGFGGISGNPTGEPSWDKDPMSVDVTVNNDVKDSAKDSEMLNVTLDEASFNASLNDFIKENYNSSARGMRITRVSYNKDVDVLKLECAVYKRNGKRSPVTFMLREANNKGSRSILVGNESTKTFKIESKQPAFRFDVMRVGKTLKCESMRYSFITSHPQQGKVKIEGVIRSKNK